MRIIGTFGFIPPERLKMWLRGPRGRTMRGVYEDVGRKMREVVARRWFEEEALIDAWSLGGESRSASGADNIVTLYMLATSNHPYEKDVQEPETLAMVPTPSRRMSVRESWAAFRSTVGESYRLGNTVLRNDGPRMKALYDACSSGVSLQLGHELIADELVVLCRSVEELERPG